MSAYVDQKLAEFVAHNLGRAVDRDGAFGPQAPDLIDAWIETLTGVDMSNAFHAADYWKRGLPAFDRIVYGDGHKVRPGDILIWSGDPGSYGTLGYGMAGIATATEPADKTPTTIPYLGQNAAPTAFIMGSRDGLLGGLRLGRFTELALEGGKPIMTSLHRDLEGSLFMLGKSAGDPKPGQVIVWGDDGPGRYGHVEIVPGWWERLKRWFRR